jgi:hypothetical protein
MGVVDVLVAVAPPEVVTVVPLVAVVPPESVEVAPLPPP